jgi:hypothetical protein
MAMEHTVNLFLQLFEFRDYLIQRPTPVPILENSKIFHRFSM